MVTVSFVVVIAVVVLALVVIVVVVTVAVVILIVVVVCEWWKSSSSSSWYCLTPATAPGTATYARPHPHPSLRRLARGGEVAAPSAPLAEVVHRRLAPKGQEPCLSGGEGVPAWSCSHV